MSMATPRIAPNMPYLLRDDQPAMKMARVFTEVMATMKTRPMLRRLIQLLLPSGMTENTIKPMAVKTMGARVKTGLSAPSGTVSSFSMSLMTSAMGCSRPNGPQRLGPTRDWNRPSALRSNQV